MPCFRNYADFQMNVNMTQKIYQLLKEEIVFMIVPPWLGGELTWNGDLGLSRSRPSYHGIITSNYNELENHLIDQF